MPGGTQFFAVGVGAAVGLAALVALVVAVVRTRKRQNAALSLTARKGRGALALRGSARGRGAGESAAGKGEFLQANPLVVQRGKAPRPPRGPPPGHCKVDFAEFHEGLARKQQGKRG